MKPLPHVYEVSLTGGPTTYATVSAGSLPDLRTAPPLDFDGPGDAWSPEQLLVAAVETCFCFTLRAVAAASKVEFTSLQLSGQGKLERTGSVTHFTEITLKPVLTLPPGSDRHKAELALRKSAQVCFVSASLATPVRVEPEIHISE